MRGRANRGAISGWTIGTWFHSAEIRLFNTVITLIGAVAHEGASLGPLDIHFNGCNRANVLLTLAKCRKKLGKRHTITERDWRRDKARLIRAGVEFVTW